MARATIPHSAGILIDVQEFFLASLDSAERARIEHKTEAFLSLLAYLQIPTVITVERPVATKGTLPAHLNDAAGALATTFEKDFFDLLGEADIRDHVTRLGRRRMIVAGCETDVCILQSTLGLLEKDYEVFIVEDLLFSSSKNTTAAVDRMKRAGATVLTFKSLFHELLRAQENSAHRKNLGALPKILATFAFD